MNKIVNYQEKERVIIEKVQLGGRKYLILDAGHQNVIVVEDAAQEYKSVDDKIFHRVLDTSRTYGEELNLIIGHEIETEFFYFSLIDRHEKKPMKKSSITN